MKDPHLPTASLEALGLEMAIRRHTRHIKKVELSSAAFGYARYSDDGQDRMSIDRQIESILETNRRHHLPIPKIFIDEARTGQNNSRPGVREMLEELDQEYGASMTVESGDRLFRSVASYTEIQASCVKNGIRVYSNRGLLTEADLPLEAFLAVMEIAKTKTRTKYKKKVGSQAGTYVTSTPYGFTKLDGRNVPNPDLVEHVVDMFQMAASGMKPGEIARVMIKKGVKSPRGKLWTASTVLNLLTNPMYDGRTMYWSQSED